QNFHPEDKDLVMAGYLKALENKEPYEVECRLRRHDGQYRWFWITSAPRFRKDGKFVGFVGSHLDITERKRVKHILEGQKQALEQVVHGEPLSGVLETLANTLEAQACDKVMASIRLNGIEGEYLNQATVTGRSSYGWSTPILSSQGS